MKGPNLGSRWMVGIFSHKKHREIAFHKKYLTITIPIGLLIPSKIVAMARCSSLNQCWLILVGTQEINGQAIPVKA